MKIQNTKQLFIFLIQPLMFVSGGCAVGGVPGS